MSNIPSDIIIPPGEVRKMIEKTAQYVAKHGVAFEQKIRAKEANNPKFLFINKNDPYNGYYQHIIATLKAKGELPLIQERREVSIIPETEPVKIPKDPKPFKTLAIEDGRLDAVEKEMTLTDLNALKQMARYSVQYGASTVDLLTRKLLANEEMNTHFGFLNRDNRFHKVYTRYQDAYSHIIKDREVFKQQIQEDSFDQDQFLDQCLTISKQVKQIKLSKRDAAKKRTETLLAYTSIDWQDFEIVETIEILDSDHFEKPLTKETLKYRTLIQKEANRVMDEESHGVEIADDDDDDQLPAYNENEGEPEKLKDVHRVPKGMKIRAAGESRLKRKMEQEATMLKCPLSGEMVPETEFPNHLKRLLRDPKFEEEKMRYEAKFKYGDNLSSTQVWENINSIVDRVT